MLSPKFILGYSSNDTVLLDFDDTSLDTVKYWARRTCKWFKLGGFIILESSENCYHVVFNRKVSWSENLKIVAWVTLLSHNKGLNRWLIMQCIKESSTLRISPKSDKPSPRIVYSEGEIDKQIKEFLKYRKFFKRIYNELEREYYANLN
jgi:hypothetical protein